MGIYASVDDDGNYHGPESYSADKDWRPTITVTLEQLEYAGPWFVDLYDVYHLLGLRGPYSKWAKEGISRHSVRAEKRFIKDNPTGRPVTHYYIEENRFVVWAEEIKRRHHVNVQAKVRE